jgi:hypothetical protein
MIRKVLKKSFGQTTIEYLLMIVVVIGMGLTFFRQMDKYILQNPNGLIGKPLNSYKKMFQGSGNPSDAYRRFYVRKAKIN